jgi:hypothetical protein
LSRAQRALLLTGDPLPADLLGGHFATEAEARAAWFANRRELMAEVTEAGRRPFGYFVHELDCRPSRWYHELAALMQRDLISTEEALAVERVHEILSPDQTAAVCAGFENANSIRAMSLGKYVLRSKAEQFDLAMAWHERRGRSGLAARYKLRAEIVRSVLREAAA